MDRPFVVCHMLSSLDGKIDGEFFSAPECRPALAEYGNLRGFYGCQATLYGTTTMIGSYADGMVGELPDVSANYGKEDHITHSDAENYVVSIDPKGVLRWSENYIEKKGRPKAYVIEVLTEAVSEAYLAYLRGFDISYPGLLLYKLKQKFSIERLMIAGGGTINWTFLQVGMIDELSLVMAPVADGSNTAVSIFEKSDFLLGGRPIGFTPKEIKQMDGGSLWLRYVPENREGV